MKSILRLFPWKLGLYLSIGVLALLIIFSFYGLYTNKFYFFKFDNYIFPFLTTVHFIFLYVLWFKIKEDETTDPQMRNLEYVLYVIFLIYIFKLVDTILILTTYSEYEDYVIPETFMPLGVFILVLYVFLVGLTLLSFLYRRVMVGKYKFNDMNQHIDSWE
ncbi:MAG: hypothetical protein COC08_06450 [Maribacter sp.]|nr:MAG: hypothetical protein COC08_06450 [Maribacter sp.]